MIGLIWFQSLSRKTVWVSLARSALRRRHREHGHAAGVVVGVVPGGVVAVSRAPLLIVDSGPWAPMPLSLVTTIVPAPSAGIGLDLDRVPVGRQQALEMHRRVDAAIAVVHGDRVVPADADQHVVRVGHADRVRVAADVAPGTGLVCTVCATLFVVLVDHREAVVVGVGDEQRVAVLVSAVGCRPTGISCVSLPVARLTTETVPVIAAPVDGLETIGVPSERLVKSVVLAGGRPRWRRRRCAVDHNLARGIILEAASTVQFGCTVEAIEQDKAGPTLTVHDTVNGIWARLRVRYVLGCDGHVASHVKRQELS